MGFLDGLLGSALGTNSASAPGLTRSILAMIGGGPNGGLEGLVSAFQQNGLGQIVDSWIGNGQNLPISAAQIQQALGPRVQALAQQHGLSEGAVSLALSQVLPHFIDHLTPTGQLPSGNDALAQGLSALRSRLGI